MSLVTQEIEPTISRAWLAEPPINTATSVSAAATVVGTDFPDTRHGLVTYSIPDDGRPARYQSCETLLQERPEWAHPEFRHAYAEAAVEQGIAWQVRINRERRGMTQKQLAAAIGTHQSAVSRMEDPEYGAHSLAQLLKIAKVFDCALLVKLATFSNLALESKFLSEDDLYVSGYDTETSEER